MVGRGDLGLDAAAKPKKSARTVGDVAGKLNLHRREHISLRLEFGMSFSEIARKVGGSNDGARMAVARALRAMITQLFAATA